MQSPLINSQLPIVTILILLLWGAVAAQDSEEPDTLFFRFEPDSLSLDVAEKATVDISLVDENGKVHQRPFLLFISGTQSRKSVRVSPRSTGEPGGTATATLEALKPGSFEFSAQTVGPRTERIRGKIPVEVAFPDLQRIAFQNPVKKLYQGTTVSYATAVFDAAGLKRADATAQLSSENPEVAVSDRFGNVTALQAGKTTLVARTEGIEERLEIQVVDNPVQRVELQGERDAARTGDVIKFTATAYTAVGRAVADAPVEYSVIGVAADPKEPHAAADIGPDGRFVAETPGDYTILAHSGPHVDRLTVRIKPRDVQKKVEVVGHGGSIDVYTSDLWVWEGIDGRDYAVTGTWEAKGHALFWDVTDPSDIKLIDTVAVDARTVNDVKVSVDGKTAIISREGASNRKNGIVILDVSDPYNVNIISEYSEQLTGGVHNLFMFEDHVYAVNNSIRYDVINIKDPAKPYRVSRFELGSPGHGVHDVWIENGIAYSSNWQDGLRLVDIGGFLDNKPFRDLGDLLNPEVQKAMKTGGSPENPIEFAHYEYPSGWNHAAFPYYSESTGKFYVLAGDEAFPYGLGGVLEKKPEIAAGWIHFIDFTDPANPQEVARYGVPEAGSHNYWVEDDVLYAAFYNGGFRAVDISGDLQGDLYAQGREIGWFLPMDKDGVVANAPMVWGPQPHKGVVFFSDMNSGLWAVKLVEKEKKKAGS